ncbi:hypothetical protein C0995_008589 [Termitomyces sp. Mi166|nr:hypothetical protein C0995_008589 [Termitomyces sp. Mi166\
MTRSSSTLLIKQLSNGLPAKQLVSLQERKEAKKAKDEFEAKYTTCLLDGCKKKIGNFHVEPPRLFRGQGDHPKKGALKDALVPVLNVSNTWKAVTHNNTVTWLANWTENANSNHEYIFLAAESSLKGQSNMQKFEKARELKEMKKVKMRQTPLAAVSFIVNI